MVGKAKFEGSIEVYFNEFIEKEALSRGLNPKNLSSEELRLLATDILMDLSKEIKNGENQSIQLQDLPLQRHLIVPRK